MPQRHAEQRVACVGVFPRDTCRTLKVEVGEPGLEVLHTKPRHSVEPGRGQWRTVKRWKSWQARGMGSQVSEGHLTAVQYRQAEVTRQIASDRVIEPHLALPHHVGQQER